MVSQPLLCKYCESSDVVRYGTQSGAARFKCKQCGRIFKSDYIYRAYEPACQRSGCGNGVEWQRHPGYRSCSGYCKEYRHLNTKKKFKEIVKVNPSIGSHHLTVEIRQLIDPSIKIQADEQWSFVQNKQNQRWWV